MKLLSCVFLVIALVITAQAADVTGKWSGTYTVIGSDGTAGESSPALLFLKQNGAMLTGTAGADESQQFPIDEAKIEGNKLTGSVSPSDGATYRVTLTVDGDRMTGEVTISQSGQTIKAKIELKRVP